MLGRVGFAAPAVAATPNLSKFTEPLPIPPVLDGTGGGKSFTIAARESTWQFHKDLPGTRTWGYWSGDTGIGYLGPTIEVTRRANDTVQTELTVKWVNDLDSAFLPNDPTLPGAVMPGEAPPMVAHLHGGENHPQFDGTPLQWFTKGGQRGPHFITDTYTYWNEQRASMVWYHDHALGNTRTNVYAGLAGLYFIRDAPGLGPDTGRADNPLGLPAGEYEIPLVLQDKTFNADGSLFYPTTGVTAYHPEWVPEFFGDTAVVNAKIAPFHAVEPRRYRLRMVNGSQARFYNLKLVNAKNGKIQTFHQIGADGGLLRAPVAMTSLLLAPGERADVIVDFAGLAGAQIMLKNDAKAPYPAGRGGEVTHLMAFNVTTPLNGTDATTPAASLALPSIPALPAGSERVQHLSETLDPITGAPIHLNVEDKPYLNATGLPDVTTKPAENAVEDWLLVNTTADTHPIHLHLVTFEVIERRPFNVTTYNAGGGIVYTGAATPVPANENGRKDTVQAHPGQVTRIRARFELPDEGTIELPASAGVTNPQYVWHCHILEHEENDMMRAFEVVR